MTDELLVVTERCVSVCFIAQTLRVAEKSFGNPRCDIALIKAW